MNNVRIRTANWDHDENILLALRREVFIEEQRVPEEEELDGRDSTATHFLAETENGDPVGCARLLPDGQIGRMAVRAPLRGRGIGRQLLDYAVDTARTHNHARVFLHAQTHAADFYADGGFEPYGQQFIDAGIPHVAMIRELPVEFVVPEEVKAARIRPEQATAVRPTFDDGPEVMHSLRGEEEIIDALRDITKRARRMVCIYSQGLDRQLFANPALASELLGFARSHAQARVRVLVHSGTALRQGGHPVIDMLYRMPSRFELRIVDDEQQNEARSWLVADRQGFVLLPDYSAYTAVVSWRDRPAGQELDRDFLNRWERGTHDPNLKPLSI